MITGEICRLALMALRTLPMYARRKRQKKMTQKGGENCCDWRRRKPAIGETL